MTVSEFPSEGEGVAFTPFAEIIAGHADRRPDAVAFQVDERTLTWHALHRRAGRVANALRRARVKPGDRVALLGSASLAYVECFFGTVAARACVVPLPVSASVPTLEALLDDCGAKVLFVDLDADGAFADMAARRAARGLRVIPFGIDDGGDYTEWRDAAGTGDGALDPARDDDPFNIIYSSGTTGLPKGIVHLHGMRQRQASRRGFFSTEARTLLSTPMYSNTTIMPLLGTVAHGGACLLMRRFDAGRYLALAARHRATHTMLVPVQYARILAHPDADTGGLASLQVSQCTGAPLDLALKRQILAQWPGRFIEVYGLTEGGVSCFLDAHAHPDKLDTVGRPGHGSEVFLIDASGRRLPPDAIGVAGEVVGRSPFMMAGYHRRPEATAEIRWLDEQGRVHHRSGDIGRFDADGFLTLLDRIKDVIISGGHNIYAADLEAVLARHEDVLDAAVIGVPSERWGETPLALVTLRPGASVTPEALRDWVNAQVGKTQRLSAVEWRDALPRSALGKLSKKALRAPYWASSTSHPMPS
ncbi:class I adenylate-forming enzyme family protein [Aquabacterium sp. J223]|uniref:class I adenylate-forming enzyme family protein n=1 Tax=Aquabacterium sp. J223 TaxID=2898431 RepID=UPI0021AD5BF2|nr:AMP-binding protein [Aquabacterium sp. J223]UUX96695.1 AMP-binding protein [Aquabacterium sp. J223]